VTSPTCDQCYLPPDTIERAPPNPRAEPERLVLDFPAPEGWKAELTYVAGYIHAEMMYLTTCLQRRIQSPIQVLTGPGVDRDQRVTVKPNRHTASRLNRDPGILKIFYFTIQWKHKTTGKARRTCNGSRDVVDYVTI